MPAKKPAKKPVRKPAKKAGIRMRDVFIALFLKEEKD